MTMKLETCEGTGDLAVPIGDIGRTRENVRWRGEGVQGEIRRLGEGTWEAGQGAQWGDASTGMAGGGGEEALLDV